jgi:predicted acyl esterase
VLEQRRVFLITIEPFATANLFKRGHCIRLDISSSNFPHFDVNPNSGEPPALARAPRIALNTVHVGADFASHVVLPIVPIASLVGLRPPPTMLAATH